jgi:hypothetical protein
VAPGNRFTHGIFRLIEGGITAYVWAYIIGIVVALLLSVGLLIAIMVRITQWWLSIL